MFKKLDDREIDNLLTFLNSANTSDKHRSDSFVKIIDYVKQDDNYHCYINIEDNVILAAVFMRDLLEQKSRVLDLILSSKNFSIYQHRVGKLVDYAIKDGEDRGYYRFYSVLTEEMMDTVDVLKKKNAIFTWRTRYDTYIDEVIEPQYFSKFYITWEYLLNTTVRDHKKIIRHHHLKPEFRTFSNIS